MDYRNGGVHMTLSAPALLALIGGMEGDVVAEFREKAVAQVSNLLERRLVAAEVNKRIDAAVEDAVLNWAGTMNQKARTAIDTAVSVAISKHLTPVTLAAIEERYKEAIEAKANQIVEAVEHRVLREITVRVEDAIAQRVEKAVDEAVKQRLASMRLAMIDGQTKAGSG